MSCSKFSFYVSFLSILESTLKEHCHEFGNFVKVIPLK